MVQKYLFATPGNSSVLFSSFYLKLFNHFSTAAYFGFFWELSISEFKRVPYPHTLE